MKRRSFIQKSALATAGWMATSGFISSSKYTKITVLHTNDMHSNIHPFSVKHPKYPGLGGIERRGALIKKIRSEETHVLLLDAGDVFQGTPYFNYFKGEIEFKAMSMMGYDAVTMGNHDFDIGLNGFKQALPHASFSFLCSNYDFSNTLLEGLTEPYKIFRRGDVRIGLFGLGVELKGLVDPELYKETKYLNPIEIANDTALFLKQEKQCDVVICLSHLGYAYNTKKISDLSLASQSANIDLIIGGHTHTFLEKPTKVKNKVHKPVFINQVGWAGLHLGRIEIFVAKSTIKNNEQKVHFFHKKNTLV